MAVQEKLAAKPPTHKPITNTLCQAKRAGVTTALCAASLGKRARCRSNACLVPHVKPHEQLISSESSVERPVTRCREPRFLRCADAPPKIPPGLSAGEIAAGSGRSVSEG